MTSSPTRRPSGRSRACTSEPRGRRHEHGAGRRARVRAAGRRQHGRDPPGRPGRLRRGQGHARGDVAGQHLPAVLQPQPAGGRDRGAADLPGAPARPRGAAGAVGRRGGRLRQLRRAGGPGDPGTWPRSRSRWRTTCTTGASPPCCSSTWSRPPGATADHASSPPRPCPRTPRCCKVFADAGLPVQRHCADGVVELTFPLPGDDGGTALDSLPERRGRAGTPRGHRQPAARAGARVGRGHRREPAAGHGGPGDPGQHPHRRVRRAAVRGQPARPADRRRALPVLGARPARAGRPGGDRGPGRGGAGRGANSAASAACGPWW